MKIILSIKPKYSQMILDGTKTVEFRRVFNKDSQFSIVYLYESLPTKMVVGQFELIGINTNYPECAYDYFGDKSGISLEEFNKYSEGKELIYSLQIKNVIRYDTQKPLSDFGLTRPPQNYCFVKEREK